MLHRVLYLEAAGRNSWLQKGAHTRIHVRANTQNHLNTGRNAVSVSLALHLNVQFDISGSLVLTKDDAHSVNRTHTDTQPP